MPKILIAPMTLADLRGRFHDELRAAGFEPVYPPRPRQLTEEELLACLGGVPAVIAGSESYPARVFEANPQLKVVARSGVGYDAVDLDAATAHGVVVTISPNTNQEAVAEHTFALILALAKNLLPHHHGLQAGAWLRSVNVPLRGRTLGIAGLGRIGKAVAVRGAAFGMRLIAYDPFPDHAFAAANGVTFVPLDQLFREADFLTLHLPLSPASRHLVNRKTLALMKPDAFLVNTARGGLVCEADLLDALRGGRLAGAGLDVFEKEPPGANPLFELDRVVLTPHTAGQDHRSREDMALSAARAVIDLSHGVWPEEKVVNPQVRSRFAW
jgi:D-3-phosphoglycerate dehydrogenase